VAELTITTFLTLDGVMQAPEGPGEDSSGGFPYGGWLVPHADADMGSTMDAIFAKADAFLLGRTTYDIFAAYWPKVTDPTEPVAAALNSLPKFVASRTRSTFEWNATTHLPAVAKGVAELKRFSFRSQVAWKLWPCQTLIMVISLTNTGYSPFR
jgi:dihydrofolate reductase